MKRQAILSFTFIVTFVWFGFVSAISFMEAPVKFTAPSLTLAIGLDVGRQVFAVLNKVEIVFALTSCILLILSKPFYKIIILFCSTAFILLLQTVWLLPALDERALMYIAGNTPPPSSLHLLYILVESLKVAALFVLGCWQIEYSNTVITSTLTQSQNKKIA